MKAGDNTRGPTVTSVAPPWVEVYTRLLGSSSSFPCWPILLPPPQTILLGTLIPSTVKWWEEQNPASPPPFWPSLCRDCQVTSSTGGKQVPVWGWFPLRLEKVGVGEETGEDPEDPEGPGSQGCVFSCKLPHELPVFLLQFSPVPARVLQTDTWTYCI